MNEPEPQRLVISATAFKTRSLQLFDDLHQGRLVEIVVTKRGKPVAVVQRPTEARPRFEDIWGCMRDVSPVDSTVDLTAPVWDGPEPDDPFIGANQTDAA